MTIIKTSFRVLLLILLCMPILYFEYYILKNTISDVMNHGKKNLSRSNNRETTYYEKEHLKIAK